MAKKQKAPTVVAELGRPETPEETAARKATDSRLYRQRKTVNNLVLSLLVSLGLMALIVFMAPGLLGGKDTFSERSVDVAELAAAAEPSAGRMLSAPEVPEGWLAKGADLRASDGVNWWRINYTTVDQAFASVTQAFTASGEPVKEAWIEKQLEDQVPTGTETLGGVEWIVYDHSDRSAEDSNMLFGLRAEIGGDTVLVYGTDTPGTLRVLAAEVAESLAGAPESEGAQ